MFSIIFSFNNEYKGFGRSDKFRGYWRFNLGWVIVEKRPHIDILDNRVKDLGECQKQFLSELDKETAMSRLTALHYFFSGDTSIIEK